MRSTALKLLALMVALVSATASLNAAELLMFEEPGCPWCARWHAEVGPGYPHTPEGMRAPLRRLDLNGARPQGIVFAAPIRASPTFVLIDRAREVGRITGYPGADFFWGLLEALVIKLNQPEAATQ